MAKTPYARTPASESRESKMRAAAPGVLTASGYTAGASRNARGMQLIGATTPEGEAITAWVKCAWAPGQHGHCAVQVDFPGPDRRAKDLEGVVRIVKEKAERAAGLGATHLLLYAADDDAKRTLAAYLMPIDQVVLATQEAIEIAPSLVKNGHSPSLYVVASTAPRTNLVDVVRRHSIDLLAEPKIGREIRLDALDDLDQEPEGAVSALKVRVLGYTYKRDPTVRSFVLRRAAGSCEYCGQSGFLLPSGAKFLEAHHIISLAEQGPDTVTNVIALCANHHREAHYGAQKAELERKMLEVLVRLNAKP